MTSYLPWIAGGAVAGYAARRARGRRLSADEVRECESALIKEAGAFASTTTAKKRMRTFKPGRLWHVQRAGGERGVASFTACPRPPATAGRSEEARIPRISFGLTPAQAWMSSYAWGDSAEGRVFHTSWFHRAKPAKWDWSDWWARESLHIYTNEEPVRAYAPTVHQVPDVWQTCEVWGLAPARLTLEAVVEEAENAELIGVGHAIYQRVRGEGSPTFRKTLAKAPPEFLRLVYRDYREDEELDPRLAHIAQAVWPHVETHVEEVFAGYGLPTEPGGKCGVGKRR